MSRNRPHAIGSALAVAALVSAELAAAAPRAPPSRPDLERGSELYRNACAQCHGAEGRGDGRRAPELDPPPRSFRAPDMREMSPARAFAAISGGVPDTAMAAFDILPAADRWSLAFYVMSLRHDRDAADRGGAALAEAPDAIADLAELARRTDAEISDELARAGIARSDRAAALAYLRHRPGGRPDPGGWGAGAIAAIALASAIVLALATAVARRRRRS